MADRYKEICKMLASAVNGWQVQGCLLIELFPLLLTYLMFYIIEDECLIHFCFGKDPNGTSCSRAKCEKQRAPLPRAVSCLSNNQLALL